MATQGDPNNAPSQNVRAVESESNHFVSRIATAAISCTVLLAETVPPSPQTDVIVTQNSFVAMSSLVARLDVRANLTVQTELEVRDTGSVNVLQDLELGGLLRVSSAGQRVVVGNVLTFLPGSRVNVMLPASATPTARGARSVTTVTSTVAQYASVSGTAAVSATLQGDPCLTTSQPVTTYGATAMTVTIQVDNSQCGTAFAGGLSSGAIAGIVVGSVLGAAIIVAVAGVIIHKRRQQASMSMAFLKIEMNAKRESKI